MRRRAPFTTTELWRAASTALLRLGMLGLRQPGAVLDNLVKGEIGHQAGTQGQQDATQQTHIELWPDPETEPASLFRLHSF